MSSLFDELCLLLQSDHPKRHFVWGLPEWAPSFKVGELYHVGGTWGGNQITERKIMASPIFVYEGATIGYHTQIHKFRSLHGGYMVSCSDIQAVETVLPITARERKLLK